LVRNALLRFYFLNEIVTDTWDDLDFSNISIVTFNYDRSLETFLVNALVAGYGKEPAQVVEKVKTMRIVHVYGSLGPTLPGTSDYLHYDGKSEPRKVDSAAKYLTVIPEGRVDSDTLVTARKLLKNAHKIAFLGFGFDLTNVARLADDDACRRQRTINGVEVVRKIVGTCVQMRRAEVRSAYQALTRYHLPTTNVPFKDCGCYDLLRDELFLREA
jgi:hypothetical protein